MFIKVKKLLSCIPKGKGARLFIVDPNLSSHGFEPSIHDMILYIKRNLKCGANARKKKKTTYETRSFNMKILQHPQWNMAKGCNYIVLLFIVFIKKDIFRLHEILF
jgi:hypothetical protein